MRDMLAGILARYGQSAVVEARETGEQLPVRAFIQPLLQERENAPLSATPLGPVSRERWLYIGGAETPLSPGDRVASHGLELTVQETKRLYCGDTLLYHWALLRRQKEAAV